MVGTVAEDLDGGAVGGVKEFDSTRTPGLVEDLERHRPHVQVKPLHLPRTVAGKLLTGNHRVGRTTGPVDGHGGQCEGSAAAGGGVGMRRGMRVIAERAALKPSSTPWQACADSIVIRIPPHCSRSLALGEQA